MPAQETLVDMELADEDATVALAGALAALAKPGDVLALRGELGTGKTTFARAFIRARDLAAGGDGGLEVPSPTFTLAQAYELSSGTVHHFDLFRIERPREADELGLDDAFADGVTLIEWPERVLDRLPAGRLDVVLRHAASENSRLATLAGGVEWRRRLSEAGFA